MKRNFFYFVAFILGFFLVSCNNGYNHIISSPNSPGFQGKGELQMNGYAGTNHFEIQGAASFTDYLGVTGSYYEPYNANGVSREAGLVLYHNSSGTNNSLEFSAGYGNGNFKGSYGYGLEYYNKAPIQTGHDYKYESAFNYFYFQPSLIWRCRNLDVSLIIKYKAMTLKNFSQIHSTEVYHYGSLSSMTHDTVSVINFKGSIIESLMQFKFKTRIESLNFILQAGCSIPSFKMKSVKNETYNLSYQPWILSLGLHLNLDLKKFKKKVS